MIINTTTDAKAFSETQKHYVEEQIKDLQKNLKAGEVSCIVLEKDNVHRTSSTHLFGIKVRKINGIVQVIESVDTNKIYLPKKRCIIIYL